VAIKIIRNDEGNCINFEGSSNPVYFNACLSGVAEGNKVNVVNDIKSTPGNTEYEFYRIPYQVFRDAQNNPFESAQQCADYITAVGNVSGSSDTLVRSTDSTVYVVQPEDDIVILKSHAQTVVSLPVSRGARTLNIKASSSCSAENPVSVMPANGQKLDGQDFYIMTFPRSAITLIQCDLEWFIL